MKLLPLLLFLFGLPSLSAQIFDRSEFVFGLRGGFIPFTIMENFKNTIVPRTQNPNLWPYTIDSAQVGFSAAAFSRLRVEGSPFVAQLELGLTRAGGSVYSNVTDTLFRQHSIFKQLYLTPGIFINWHPLLLDDATKLPALNGLHLGLGVAYNIYLKKKVSFKSHDPSKDAWVEEYEKLHILPKSHLMFLGNFGYEYIWRDENDKPRIGVCVNARYGFGLGDANAPDAFIYEDSDVRLQYFLISAGLMFPVFR